jgi:flagellar basal-body rod protein FlgC
MFDAMNVSASGLTAQRLRMDVISQNIANAQTTRTPEGGPYKRRTVIFQEITENDPFASLFSNAVRRSENPQGAGRRSNLVATGKTIAMGNSPAGIGMGVRVSRIAKDEAPGILAYDPHHPDADEEGYVRLPNVNIVEEMVNMISASRSYEANITAINTTRAMITRTLEIGRN